MKKYILLLLISMFITGVAFADDKHCKDEKAIKEEIFQSKVKTMAEKLQLTPEQLEKFIPIYREYVDDALSMRPKHFGDTSVLTRHGKIKPGKSLSADQAYSIASERIAIQRHVLDAQQKALQKLQNVLTPQQLLDFPHVESQMGRRAAEAWKDRHDARKKIIEARKKETKDRLDARKKEIERRKKMNEERRKKK